jgi:hypothetical protein
LEALFGLLILGAIVSSIVICGLKGKWGMLVGGFFLGILWPVGAIRLAKPNSWWARENYQPGSAKMNKARARHEGVITVAS